MMDLSEKQWVSHAVFHPFEGFDDMRWKKAGSLKISFAIVFLFFAGRIVNDRLYAFHFHMSYDKLFNIVPYFIGSVVLFAAWVTGNWAVCTLLDGEGTLKRICICSAYALVPYTVSLYLSALMSHVLVTDEGVFIQIINYAGVLWSALLLFNAVRAVHQYSAARTAAAVLLTLAAMFIILFLCVMLITLFQKVFLFVYSVFTEIQYRVRT